MLYNIINLSKNIKNQIEIVDKTLIWRQLRFSANLKMISYQNLFKKPFKFQQPKCRVLTGAILFNTCVCIGVLASFPPSRDAARQLHRTQPTQLTDITLFHNIYSSFGVKSNR